ncbi:hypothetical protein GCM10007380_15480 [Gottfriedia solisilvae]|uniref:Uncharacterized protein n=1 Tax=Gottfriedia solisilvae TaxID=1516104 RepID=A0A8J3F139_9BACI|nr:hypothetical protein GCM10007380_15480 [Gottfriedia solisilvae]
MRKRYLLIFLTFILFYTFALWLVDSNVEYAIMSTSGGNYSIISTYFYDKYEYLNWSYKVIKFDRIIVFIYSIIFVAFCLIKKRLKI